MEIIIKVHSWQNQTFYVNNLINKTGKSVTMLHKLF